VWQLKIIIFFVNIISKNKEIMLNISGVEQKQSNTTKISESISTKNLNEDFSDSNVNILTNEQTEPSNTLHFFYIIDKNN